MAITKIILNGTTYDVGTVYYTAGTETYDGVEIAEDWAAIQEAAAAGTTQTLNSGQGLRVGDYKTISLTDGTTVKCQVAGIDTYYRTGDEEVGHHIDFISKDCLPDTVVWNTSNTSPGNNGTSTVTNPFMASNVYSYLENTIYPTLPSDLQAVILAKHFLIETRYDSSKLLSDSNGFEWVTIPHLWLPTEFEITGAEHGGTKFRSGAQAVQYPLFVGSTYHRMKGAGNGGSRCGWWTATAFSGNTTDVMYVSITGAVTIDDVTYTNLRVPLCFTVG